MLCRIFALSNGEGPDMKFFIIILTCCFLLLYISVAVRRLPYVKLSRSDV